MTNLNPKTSIFAVTVLATLLCVLASAQHSQKHDSEVRAQPLSLNYDSTVQPTGNVQHTPPLLTQTPIVCPTSTSFSLNLRYKNLTDAQAEEILINYAFECQMKFELLTSFSIDLSTNNLTSIKCITYATRIMKKLVELNIAIQNNRINNPGLTDAQDMFQFNRFLQSLSIDLEGNEIADLYPFKLAFRWLTKLSSLTLYFGSNQITNAAFASTAFYQLTELQSLILELSYNNITSTAPLAFAFEKSVQLKNLSLYLNNNQIPTIDFVRTAFQKLTSLRKFDLRLHYNSILDVSPFETAFDNNRALQSWYVLLFYNNISQGIDQLIDGIQVDIGDRKAFCPFYFDMNPNPLTDSQKERLGVLKISLQKQYSTVNCTSRSFAFNY